MQRFRKTLLAFLNLHLHYSSLRALKETLQDTRATPVLYIHVHGGISRGRIVFAFLSRTLMEASLEKYHSTPFLPLSLAAKKSDSEWGREGRSCLALSLLSTPMRHRAHADRKKKRVARERARWRIIKITPITQADKPKGMARASERLELLICTRSWEVEGVCGDGVTLALPRQFSALLKAQASASLSLRVFSAFFFFFVFFFVRSRFGSWSFARSLSFFCRAPREAIFLYGQGLVRP